MKLNVSRLDRNSRLKHTDNAQYMLEADNCQYTDYQKMKGRILDRALKIRADLNNFQADKNAGARLAQRLPEGTHTLLAIWPNNLLEEISRVIDSTYKDLAFDTIIDPAKDTRSTTPNEKGGELAADILRNNNITILH